MICLQSQDRMLTNGMGGVLPEQADPTLFRRVLDVACGTGGWLTETAKAYPKNYDVLYEQMGQDMQEPDFVAKWKCLTI